MTVTDLIRNFHGLLEVCLPFLFRAGLTIGDDEWDDFVETAFQATVCAPLETNSGQVIAWKYGTWCPPDTCEGQISVTANINDAILIGELDSDSDEIKVRYSERQYPGASVEFAFREFAHPLLEVGTTEWMRHVLGEVVDTGTFLNVGTRVCIPLRCCKFELGS
jgi:hypothetical protein